jgi:hypothetical protein
MRFTVGSWMNTENPQRDQEEDDGDRQPGRGERIPASRPDQTQAHQEDEDRPGFDHPDDEALANSQCEIAVHRFAAGHAPEQREDRGGPERDDGAADVQVEEDLPQELHAILR